MLPPVAPTARMGSRRPEWALPPAITIGTGPSTCSRRISPATPRRSTPTTARGSARTAPSPPASALNTRWLGWGVGFVDLDNDGWLDLFLVNGHVYPEVERLKTEAAYKQRKVVYRNLGNGRFEDITAKLGAAGHHAGRGPRRGIRRLRQRWRHRRHREQHERDARSLQARSPRRRPLDHAQARRHAIEPRRDWCAGDALGCRRHPGPGGTGWRELLFAERSAGPLRPRPGDTSGPDRGSLA